MRRVALPARGNGAPGRIRTCDRRLSLPTTAFAAPGPCLSLWSGLSLRHLRRRTYSLYGSPRTFHALRFPRDCHQHYLLRVPRYSAVHWAGFVSRHRLLTQRPMLYPVELRALQNTQLTRGRGRRIRTADPLLPKQMRYQTAPCPEYRYPATGAVPAGAR